MQASWGAPSSSGLGDMAVPADYDGDGITDLAIYRQATGEWFARRSSDLSLFQLEFGAAASSGLGDRPVPADYDGDGAARPSRVQGHERAMVRPGVVGAAGISIPWGSPALADVPAR
jgi:hypothetical protein